MLFFFSLASAADNLDVNANDGTVLVESEQGGEVLIEKPYDLTLSYKQRRTTHGVLFSMFTEKFYPEKYLSLIDDKPLKIVNDDAAIDMVGAELGYKYNFKLGSVAALFNFSTGRSSKDTGAEKRNLELQKTGLSMTYAADALFEEPWIVPYGQVGIHTISVKESLKAASAAEKSDSSVTDICFNYRAGVLIQLNWIEKSIDPTTHAVALRSSGLENTFLDIYASWYQPAQKLFDPENPIETANEDPDLRSEGRIGVGLKLEF